MKVRELIETLQHCIRDAEVVISDGPDVPFSPVTDVLMEADGRDFSTRAVIRRGPRRTHDGLVATAIHVEEVSEERLDAAIRRVSAVMDRERHPDLITGFLLGKSVAFREIKAAVHGKEEDLL